MLFHTHAGASSFRTEDNFGVANRISDEVNWAEKRVDKLNVCQLENFALSALFGDRPDD